MLNVHLNGVTTGLMVNVWNVWIVTLTMNAILFSLIRDVSMGLIDGLMPISNGCHYLVETRRCVNDDIGALKCKLMIDVKPFIITNHDPAQPNTSETMRTTETAVNDCQRQWEGTLFSVRMNLLRTIIWPFWFMMRRILSTYVAHNHATLNYSHTWTIEVYLHKPY